MYNYQPQTASTAIAVGQMITRASEAAANITMEGAKMRAQMRMQAASTNAEIITQGSALRANLALERYKTNLSASVSREQIAASRAASAASNALGRAQLRLEGYKADRADALARDRMDREDSRAIEAENRADQRAADARAADKAKTDQSMGLARDSLAWEKEKFAKSPEQRGEEEKRLKAERGANMAELPNGGSSGGTLGGLALTRPLTDAMIKAYYENSPKVKTDDPRQPEVDNPWYSAYLTSKDREERAKTAKAFDKAAPLGSNFKLRDRLVAELTNPEQVAAFDTKRKALANHVINALGTPDVFGEFGEIPVVMPLGDGKQTVTIGTSMRRARALPTVIQNAVDQYEQAASFDAAYVPLDNSTQARFAQYLSGLASTAEAVASADREGRAGKALMGVAMAPASKTAIISPDLNPAFFAAYGSSDTPPAYMTGGAAEYKAPSERPENIIATR